VGQFTKGNVDDRTPVPNLTKHVQGLLFGDKGYIKQFLFEQLLAENMQPKIMLLFEKIMLKKRSIIESVFGVLKQHFDLEHTRHRSTANAFVHMLSTIAAYCMKKTKPTSNNLISTDVIEVLDRLLISEYDGRFFDLSN
jgi:hypothetical protein